jgi:CHAD domain-containing protein
MDRMSTGREWKNEERARRITPFGSCPNGMNPVPLTITPTADADAGTVGLETRMKRVLDLADKIRPEWDSDDVHDLRVALRRSRTIAEALSEVNPAPGWRKLKKGSSKLFHDLGALRDAQVQQIWVKKLGAPRDPVRKWMVRSLSRQEKKLRRSAEQALDEFDRKQWRRLARRLPPKAQLFPLESVVFRRLALGRLNQVVELQQRARKTRSSVAWHRLRIGLKQFRYIAENFLPRRYEVWAEDLKRMQDLLGEVHDLDMLRQEIRRQGKAPDVSVVSRWLSRIDAERKARINDLLAKISGKQSPWIVWRAGLQWGHHLVPALPAAEQRRTA